MCKCFENSIIFTKNLNMNRLKSFSFTIITLMLLNSCNDSQIHKHDGTYENSLLGIDRKIVLNGNNATITGSITGTTESEVTQFDNRVEYIEENGNTTTYYFLENGDLKVNDYLIFNKVQ